MDRTPIDQQREMETILAGLEKVRVMVCIENFSLVGQTYYAPGQRFLDMLNKELVLGKQRTAGFIVVTQALLTGPHGEKERLPHPCFVSKDAIILVGTFDDTRATTVGNINPSKYYPWRQKDTVSAEMVFAGKYRLTGQMHHDPWQLPVGSVETPERFLPMTNARVISLAELREISFDFVAVNKKHLSLFQVP